MEDTIAKGEIGPGRPAELARNELEGIACPYNIPDSAGLLYTPGSLGSSCQGVTWLFHEHTVPIGLARLSEESRRVMIRARISPVTTMGKAVLRAIHAGFLRALCPMVDIVQSRSATTPFGTLTVITAGRVREVSVLLLGALPGAEITRTGRLDFTLSPWDRRFAEGLPFLTRAMAENAQRYLNVCEQDLAGCRKSNGGEYETWINSLEF